MFVVARSIPVPSKDQTPTRISELTKARLLNAVTQDVPRRPLIAYMEAVLPTQIAYTSVLVEHKIKINVITTVIVCDFRSEALIGWVRN